MFIQRYNTFDVDTNANTLISYREDLDLDKELDLLNAALDGEPATFKSTSKVDSLDDDDDLFADLEEFLNEERRNL